MKDVECFFDTSHYYLYDYTPNTALPWAATGPTCPVHTLKAFDIQNIQTWSTCVACHT